MKKKYWIIMPASALLILSGCGYKSEKPTDEVEQTEVSDVHNARNSLDYLGIYKGILTFGNDSGYSVTIELKEKTYAKMVVDPEGNILRTLGSYSWNKEGNTVTLQGNNGQNQFFVGENTLFLLDKDGKKPSPDQPGCVLRKE